MSGLFFISGAAMAIEEPNYSVLSQVNDFELRRYDEQIVAQTWVTGDQKSASREGFKILADYIFGNNTATSGESSKISMTAPVTMQSEATQPESKKGGDDKSQKIAMTAPVSIQQADNKWLVQFTMPHQYTMETLPKPNNAAITIKKVPAQNYGVIKFSGLAGSKKVAENTKKLQSWMQEQQLAMTSEAELARYNPPWTLPFMRRNEMMIAYQPK